MDLKLKTALFLCSLLLLVSCVDLRLPLGQPAPATPTLNRLAKFYRPNPGAPNQPIVYGTQDVQYQSVGWEEFIPERDHYLQKDFILLGECHFAEPFAMPHKQNSIDYARYLGATLVLYAIRANADGTTEHRIDFFRRREDEWRQR